MAGSDRNTRRAEEVERARHIASGEAAAFATTAGTMLLGLLAGAEAAQHRSEVQHAPAVNGPAPPSPRPTETDPAGQAPHDQQPAHDRPHASAVEGLAADPIPTIHVDATATVQIPGTTIDAAPGDQPATAHTLAMSIPVGTVGAPAEHTPPAGGSTGPDGGAAPPSFNPAASPHALTDTITELVDTSLAMVSQTIADLDASVAQLTSSLSGTVSDLVDGLSGAVTNLTHHTPVAEVVDPLLTDIPAPASTATQSSGFDQHGASLLDTAGAVPMTLLLHPPPLHLGFLGQPTADGHEIHDGAFSALGVHHF